MWDLAPQPGVEPMPPAVEARSLNHWTTREVPTLIFLMSFSNTLNTKYRRLNYSLILKCNMLNIENVYTENINTVTLE